MKTCRRCQVEKPHGEFHRRSESPDGYQHICKSCKSGMGLVWRQENAERDKHNKRSWQRANPDRVREHHRRWRESTPEYQRERSRRWREANPETVLASSKKWAQEHRERMAPSARARQAVYRATKSGRLVRPDVCGWCGNDGKIEAAHQDYSKPLEVLWLCVPCHRTWDIHEPKTLVAV